MTAIHHAFSEDQRITPWHISLYYALFHTWNANKFRNPISICRSEMMQLAKVGSANTYTKCLKQLHEWQYIEYLPSHNPTKGSLVNLYRFDNSTDKGAVIVVRPSINNTNNLNQKKIFKKNKQKKEESTIKNPGHLHTENDKDYTIPL